MKILYGVVGEGMGHAIRSRVVLQHLLARGHQVEVMASSRAHGYLSQRFSGVNQIHGLHLVSEENRVRLGKTLWSNLVAGIGGVPRNIGAYFELLDDFHPEVVISDFESWSYYYGKAHDLPTFSIDNMQIINRCMHPPEILAGQRVQFELVRAFVKSKLPFCHHYLITSFFRPPVRKERTSLFPPILRDEILQATPRRGDHLLIYQTGETFKELADSLQRAGMESRVYGMRRELQADEVDGNLRFRPFSEETFIEDLATARAVVASAGFTLMGEAVYLRKPMLTVPLGKQFEQLLNGRYLEREGFGMTAESLAGGRVLTDFLANLPRYEANLTRYAQAGNSMLFEALDIHLDRAARGVFRD